MSEILHFAQEPFVTNQRVLLDTTIDGEFEGFDSDKLFVLSDGTFWLQDEYKYWYHYEYCPRVQIVDSAGEILLQVEGETETVAVRQIFDVICSKINGEFRGWDGSKSYALVNGQVWQQYKYKYKYKYAYRPVAVIYASGGHHIMLVAGTSASVRRVR
jgi:hypothetical protein